MNVGKNIKLLRIDKNIRQGKMAKKLKITQNYLSLIENGKRRPSFALLLNIAASYKTTVGFLTRD